MLTASRLCFLTALMVLTGCPVWEPLESCAEFDACDTTNASSSSDGIPTTSGDGGVQTVTGDHEEAGTTSLATGDSTGQPAELPNIIDYQLMPNPIATNGPIVVTVTAEHTVGIRMETGLGDVVELTPQAQPGMFAGEISVLTGLHNGPHMAMLTPWEDMVEGATVDVPYQIALPPPGSEKLWETGDLIGPGQVVAMDTLPTGELIELGGDAPKGVPRCYLRMRDKAGLWALADVVDVLPDTPCRAIDLKISEEGALFVLVEQKSNIEAQWRLFQTPAWGQSPKHMGIGAKDEEAVALAHHESGMVAVCGTAPTGQIDDLDAMAQIFRPNLPGEPWVVDYVVEDKFHEITEWTHDCIFVGDTLALVGAASGSYDGDLEPRDRLFVLRLDTAAKTVQWTVPPPGDSTQSGARAVATDDQGRLVIAAFTCDDDCKPKGDLRIYDTEDTLRWQASLGNFPTKDLVAHDLAWSPAGYAVVATGGLKGKEAAFTVRAFSTTQVEALWTFSHEDLQVLYFALALAVGDHGEVYAGGFGSNGYPAIAFIAG